MAAVVRDPCARRRGAHSRARTACGEQAYSVYTLAFIAQLLFMADPLAQIQKVNA